MIVSDSIIHAELADAAHRFIDASRRLDAGLDVEHELGAALDELIAMLEIAELDAVLTTAGLVVRPREYGDDPQVIDRDRVAVL